MIKVAVFIVIIVNFWILLYTTQNLLAHKYIEIFWNSQKLENMHITLLR